MMIANVAHIDMGVNSDLRRARKALPDTRLRGDVHSDESSRQAARCNSGRLGPNRERLCSLRPGTGRRVLDMMAMCGRAVAGFARHSTR